MKKKESKQEPTIKVYEAIFITITFMFLIYLFIRII